MILFFYQKHLSSQLFFYFIPNQSSFVSWLYYAILLQMYLFLDFSQFLMEIKQNIFFGNWMQSVCLKMQSVWHSGISVKWNFGVDFFV